MTAPSPQCDVGLILAAAGSSRRFAQDRNKLLEQLDGTPVLCHTLARFAPVLLPEHVVVVAPPHQLTLFEQTLSASGLGPFIVVPGGDSRHASVLRGLNALPQNVRVVAVQDAARPHTSLQLLLDCIASARLNGTGVAAKRVTDTIKFAAEDGRVLETPDRSKLWAAETPQVFERGLLARAYDHLQGREVHVTDDSQAVELLGVPVFLVEHDQSNPKITHLSDLRQYSKASKDCR